MLKKAVSREEPHDSKEHELVILRQRNNENGAGFTLLGIVGIPLGGEARMNIYSTATGTG